MPRVAHQRAASKAAPLVNIHVPNKRVRVEEFRNTVLAQATARATVLRDPDGRLFNGVA